MFANEFEIKELFESDNFEDAAKEISSMVEIAFLTRGKDGAKIYYDNGQIFEEGNKKDGKTVGLYKRYHNNGTAHSIHS